MASADAASPLPTYVSLPVAVMLMFLSALFSGLTLGLMSLDRIELQVQADAGETRAAEHARRILPLRRRGNLLLCTLLLGNTVVNAGIAILLSDLTDGILGLVLSTAFILVFGEILPQAICTRHGLLIGAHLTWVVRFFMLLFLPITIPIAWLLDKMLGKDIGQSYNRAEIKKLINIHVTDPDVAKESGLSIEDEKLLVGALDFRSRRVRDIFTPLCDVFMLSVDDPLNFEQLIRIYRSGCTRIPVYSGSRENVVGVLYAKDLVLISPDQPLLMVRDMLEFRGEASAPVYVHDDAMLGDVFLHFKRCQTHMLVAVAPQNSSSRSSTTPAEVTSNATKGDDDDDGEAATTMTARHDDKGKTDEQEQDQEVNPWVDAKSSTQCTATGIVTLEDVLEEVLQEELVDEHDVRFSNRHEAFSLTAGEASASGVDESDIEMTKQVGRISLQLKSSPVRSRPTLKSAAKKPRRRRMRNEFGRPGMDLFLQKFFFAVGVHESGEDKASQDDEESV